MEKNLEEGKKELGIDSDGTSTSAETTPIELSNNITPTEEEMVDGGIIDEPAEPASVVAEEAVVESMPEENNVTTVEVDEVNGNDNLFTQEEVNELTGKIRVDTRKKTFDYIYGRYGVNDEKELDDIFEKSKSYDSLKEEYETSKADWETEKNNIANESSIRDNKIAELQETVALLQSGIDPNRYDDAKFILKGKGLPVNAESIAAEMATHPEWKKEEPVMEKIPTNEKVSSLQVFGNESSPSEESEEDYIMKKFYKMR